MKNIITYLGAIALATFIFTGCGGGGGSKPADTSAYEAAVTAYLEKESMGMKVAEVESLEESGDTAKGFIRLQDAEGLTSVKVKWEFDFKKSGDSWTVTTAREAK